MALGRYDYEDRYRRRFWLAVIKTVLLVVFVISVGLFSYQFAIERGKAHDAKRDEAIQSLSRQITELQVIAAQFQQAARNAEARVKELDGRIAAEVPTGERARLLQLLSERMDAGVSADRLAFMIGRARMPTNCAGPETKRFIVASPHNRAPARGTTFDGGTITVSAEGEAARDRNGGAEGWFDTARPVSIKIAVSGDKETVVSGMLPLRQAVIAGNKEVRLTFNAGSRSYIEAAAETCDFP